MSSDTIAKLPSPLKGLVTALAANSPVETKPQINEWIEKVASGQP